MSESMTNHCPPETKAPAMHAHDATSKTEDIKPKVISTAHKRLSQDEFQRKVAMAARTKSAMEKEANPWVALTQGARAAGFAARHPIMARLAGVLGGAKSLFRTGMLPGATKTWANLPTRIGAGFARYQLSPYGLVTPAAAAAAPFAAGALRRGADAIGGTVNAVTGGGNNTNQAQGFGNAMNMGLLGLGGGALAGAMMPGEEEYEDEDGRIRKRKGSMLAGALRGAGLGALGGGAVGFGMDHFGPKMAAAQAFGAQMARQRR